MSAEDSNIENGLAQTEGMDTQDPNAQAGGDITENDDERFVFLSRRNESAIFNKNSHNGSM